MFLPEVGVFVAAFYNDVSLHSAAARSKDEWREMISLYSKNGISKIYVGVDQNVHKLLWLVNRDALVSIIFGIL